jgi:hypothetical protein
MSGKRAGPNQNLTSKELDRHARPSPSYDRVVKMKNNVTTLQCIGIKALAGKDNAEEIDWS